MKIADFAEDTEQVMEPNSNGEKKSNRTGYRAKFKIIYRKSQLLYSPRKMLTFGFIQILAVFGNSFSSKKAAGDRVCPLEPR
jgi:hypothetical protein